jgi:hypothetical protein
MKRDMDLIRNILLTCESHDSGYAPKELKIDSYTEEQIGFHVHLMGQAGLLETIDITTLSSRSPSAVPSRITWEGYEFLEACKNEGNWQKVRSAAQASGGFVLSAAKDVLVRLLAISLAQQVGLKP